MTTRVNPKPKAKPTKTQAADAIAMQIAEFKARIQSMFIGNCTRRKDIATQGMFTFNEAYKDAAIHAMAMQIEATLGSDVKHSDYSVFLIEPNPAHKAECVCQIGNGYMGWKATP